VILTGRPDRLAAELASVLVDRDRRMGALVDVDPDHHRGISQ
jgi:hypothetical protein